MKHVLALFVTLNALAACGTVMEDPVSPDGAAGDDVGADADPGLVTLTVHTTGGGTGVVTSTDGIDCGSACTVELAVGTQIELAASPGAGATFAGWSGACDGTELTCVLVLTADASVDAEFAIARHTVTIMTAGNGDGAVTSDVGGLACPDTCVATVLHGTALNLTATAAGTSSFLGWSGDCTGTTGCSITVTDDVEVHAAFALDQTLVVDVDPTGNGTGIVTSMPGGINCGPDCNQVYAAGEMVTLHAAPAATSTFIGWTGACTGTADCVVTLDGAVGVGARFELKRYNLTVTIPGGGGTVTSAPAGVSCPGDCVGTYNHGQVVQLTAASNAQSTFTGWSGACSGTGACNVTMTQARAVTATFAPMFVVEAEQGGGNGATVPLGASTDRACFLSGVGGAFAIGGGDAHVYIAAGQWYLGVTGNITAYAQCIAWPSTVDLELDVEYPWQQDHPAVGMGSATNRFCGLTRMSGHYGGGGELIWADIIGGEWMLHGTGLEAHADVSAGARCVTWPASTGLSYTGESLWTQGPPTAPAPDVDLGPVGARACVLTLIVGYFLGGGENIYVRPSGGSWHQGGASAQNGVASRARCLTAP